jgi:hypothetical protein
MPIKTNKSAKEIKPKRIGVILLGLNYKSLPALQYLILHMNVLQKSFEYELLPFDSNDDFIQLLSGKDVDDNVIGNKKANEFTKRQKIFLERTSASYELWDTPPEHYVVVCMARMSSNYYSIRFPGLSILAFGNWETLMAPPSILEFIITMILAESMRSISEKSHQAFHLGTKGCISDFTPDLDLTRYKVLNHFICNNCRELLTSEGFPQIADDVMNILDKKWLGSLNDPTSPASIAQKLGYDLFTTKGFEASPRQKIRKLLAEEGVKQIISIIGTILVAGILLWLGLK